MWEGPDGKGARTMHELSVVDECREMEQETVWCSSGGGSNVKAVDGLACNTWVLRPVWWDMMAIRSYRTIRGVI